MIPIISVTGTKGKTSVVRAVEAILKAEVRHTLRVDTEGAWLDGARKITHEDSKRLWGLAPANSPGRFITLLANERGSMAAVLEANLFSSKACGLGYSTHKVGVFTNVFEDHKGADTSLQTKEDIAKAKSFIFSRVSNGGYVVYNADDPLVVAQLKKLPKKKSVTKIACSLNIPASKAGETQYLYVEPKTHSIIYQVGTQQHKLGKTTDFAMYVPGFQPSAYNLLFVIGALIGYFDGLMPAPAMDRLKKYQTTEVGGRFVIFKSQDNRFVIFDFAHEKESLAMVSEFAKYLSPNGRVLGVLRLSPTRKDELIVETAEAIAQNYDAFYIYDKIDGITRKPDSSLHPFQPEKVGYISKLFSDSLKQAGAHQVHHILSEQEALKKAASHTSEGDVIIYVQGNNPKDSLKFLYELFNNNLQRIA